MNIQTCRHTMTEKWTKRKTERKMRPQNSRTQNNGKGRNNEIRDIERRRRANGGGAHRTTKAETGGREKESKGGEKGNRRNTDENRTHRKRKTENPPLYGREGEFSRFREIEISRYRKIGISKPIIGVEGYLTSSKSTSSAVGPLEPLLSVGPACGPCGPA